jgi:hypothetical protein
LIGAFAIEGVDKCEVLLYFKLVYDLDHFEVVECFGQYLDVRLVILERRAEHIRRIKFSFIVTFNGISLHKKTPGLIPLSFVGCVDVLVRVNIVR